MNELIIELQSYLAETFGVSAKLEPMQAEARTMPIFLESVYSLYQMRFNDRKVLLFCQKSSPNLTPGSISKHLELLRKIFASDIAFVFPRLASFERKRLVQYRVPFIVPKQQTYLPDLLIDLRSLVRTGGSYALKTDESTPLSTPAQILFLYYIQHGLNLKPMSLREWTQILGFSTMTTSRIADELDGCKLCKKDAQGKKVILVFDTDRYALWQRALPKLRNPILRLSFVNAPQSGNTPFIKAGLSALSQYSSLDQGQNIVCALKASDYRRALDEGRLVEQPSLDDDSMVIEQWRYRPELLSNGHLIVDRLSLYLTLKNDHNERVEAALEEMIGGFKW
jgi:hypothetical protein